MSRVVLEAPISAELGFLSFIIANITGSDECFELTKSVDERGVLLRLRVDKAHLGRVIGKEGSTAKALRNLLGALGMEHNARYNLLIDER